MRFNQQLKGYLVCFLQVAFLCSSLTFPQNSYAEQPAWMPQAGVMIHLSAPYVPAHLQGITIHPDNALQFDFLIHHGDGKLTDSLKRHEYEKLVKYFLASLTLPDEDQWVNLSPYEKDRIIKDDFGKTEMGRDLLTQDYILKQITSSLIYPEDGLGKKFWDKIYERAWKEYGTTQVPVNTFNKVWIVPDEAVVYESGNTAYILKSHLKVMLEEDYFAKAKQLPLAPSLVKRGDQLIGSPSFFKEGVGGSSTLGSQIIREVILPELEREVNEGKNFANLRQIYSGMILATWYKKALKESLLGKIYADKAKVKGVDQKDAKDNVAIYQQYLKAFKKGAFNYIKEDYDQYTKQLIPRKYFSGGFNKATGHGNMAMKVLHKGDELPTDLPLESDIDQAKISLETRKENSNRAMVSKISLLRGTALIVGAVGIGIMAAKYSVEWLHAPDQTHKTEQKPKVHIQKSVLEEALDTLAPLENKHISVFGEKERKAFDLSDEQYEEMEKAIETLKKISLDPQTRAEDLVRIVHFNAGESFSNFAAYHQNLPLDVIKELVEQGSKEQQEAVAFNPHLTQEQMFQLAKANIQTMNFLTQQPDLPHELFLLVVAPRSKDENDYVPNNSELKNFMTIIKGKEGDVYFISNRQLWLENIRKYKRLTPAELLLMHQLKLPTLQIPSVLSALFYNESVPYSEMLSLMFQGEELDPRNGSESMYYKNNAKPMNKPLGKFLITVASQALYDHQSTPSPETLHLLESNQAIIDAWQTLKPKYDLSAYAKGELNQAILNAVDFIKKNLKEADKDRAMSTQEAGAIEQRMLIRLWPQDDQNTGEKVLDRPDLWILTSTRFNQRSLFLLEENNPDTLQAAQQLVSKVQYIKVRGKKERVFLEAVPIRTAEATGVGVRFKWIDRHSSSNPYHQQALVEALIDALAPSAIRVETNLRSFSYREDMSRKGGRSPFELTMTLPGGWYQMRIDEGNYRDGKENAFLLDFKNTNGKHRTIVLVANLKDKQGNLSDKVLTKLNRLPDEQRDILYQWAAALFSKLKDAPQEAQHYQEEFLTWFSQDMAMGIGSVYTSPGSLVTRKEIHNQKLAILKQLMEYWEDDKPFYTWEKRPYLHLMGGESRTYLAEDEMARVRAIEEIAKRGVMVNGKRQSLEFADYGIRWPFFSPYFNRSKKSQALLLDLLKEQLINDLGFASEEISFIDSSRRKFHIDDPIFDRNYVVSMMGHVTEQSTYKFTFNFTDNPYKSLQVVIETKDPTINKDSTKGKDIIQRFKSISKEQWSELLFSNLVKIDDAPDPNEVRDQLIKWLNIDAAMVIGDIYAPPAYQLPDGVTRGQITGEKRTILTQLEYSRNLRLLNSGKKYRGTFYHSYARDSFGIKFLVIPFTLSPNEKIPLARIEALKEIAEQGIMVKGKRVQLKFVNQGKKVGLRWPFLNRHWNDLESHQILLEEKLREQLKKDLKTDYAAITKTPVGGIDLNAAKLNLQIKRDGRGVPLPLPQQDWAMLNSIDGFVPRIIEIQPAIGLPIFSELKEKSQTSLALT